MSLTGRSGLLPRGWRLCAWLLRCCGRPLSRWLRGRSGAGKEVVGGVAGRSIEVGDDRGVGGRG